LILGVGEANGANRCQALGSKPVIRGYILLKLLVGMSERRYRLVNLYPHISTVVLLTALGLRAVWKAPDWGHKLLELAVAIRSFRGHPPHGETDDPGGRHDRTG